MADYAFSLAERHAVFTAHGPRCYIGREPIDMSSFHVDHVIPESLSKNEPRLKQVLVDLGRPSDFDVNSFENWLPACPSCNVLKGETVWDPSLLVQLALQAAASKADSARSHAAATVRNQEVGKALATLRRAYEQDDLDEKWKAQIRPLVEDYAAHRQPEGEALSPEPKPSVVKLTPTYSVPLYEVLSDDGFVRTVKGPYGVGGGPSVSRQQHAAPGCSCGSLYFNGARCVLCGAMDDD
jgi:hypothetical protein